MFNIKKTLKDNRVLLKNNIALAVSTIIEKILLLLTAVFLARYLGVADYGKWGLVFSFCAIISIINDYGLRIDMMRKISKNFSNIKTEIGNVMTLSVIISAILIIITIFLPESIVNGEIKSLCIIILAAGIFNGVSGALMNTFSAKQMMEYNSFVRLTSAALMIIGYIGVIFFHQGLYALAIVTLINRALISIIVMFLVRKKFSINSVIIKPKMWKALLLSAVPFALGFAISRIYFKIDMVMMSWMNSGDFQLGLYNATTNVIVNLQFLPLNFGYTIFPILSSLSMGSKSFAERYRKYIKISLAITLPIAIIIALFPTLILNIIFGKSYETGALSLRILSLFLLFSSITIVQKNRLSATGYQKLILKVMFAGIILNVLMNLYFIRALGYVGASITTVISEFFTMVIFTILIMRMKERNRGRDTLKKQDALKKKKK